VARPTRALVTHLAAALGRALVGSRLDRLWRTGPRQLLVKARGLGGGRVLVDLEQGHPRVVVSDRWPDTPSAPDRPTLILRNHLENARITAIRATDRALIWELAGPDGARTLHLQLAGRYPNAALFDGDGAELVRLVDGIPAADPGSPPLPDGADPYPDLDDAAFFAAYEAASQAGAEARALEREVVAARRDARSEVTRLERTVAALERDLTRAEAAEGDRHRGELLKTVIGRVERGATEVLVADWAREDGGRTAVALAPELDVVANMERYFKRYRKYANARGGIEDRLLDALTARDAVSDLLARLDTLAAPCALPSEQRRLALAEATRELAAQAPPRPRQVAPARRDGDAPALPYRRFVSRDGIELLVGKGARDNDRLTFQVARGHDLWLHARDVAGSHVIVRARGGAVPSETLLDAALLAAWHSKARGDTVVDVMWTERKHVRKARGAAPGLVTTAATRNLAVRADPDRLARLYRTLDVNDGGA
jgi:predicted ribosome quality control (RQC) complex YloA/Tae2 family protein